MSSRAAGPSLLNDFLKNVVDSIRSKNGQRVTQLIQLDFEGMNLEQQKPYSNLNAQLNAQFPRDNDAGLVDHCKQAISSEEFGSFSSSFSDSIIHYFRYVRDFTTADNQQKAFEIRHLTSQCITALGDSKYGVIMIPIVLSFSRTLAAIATNLDRNPELLKQAVTPITSTTAAGEAQTKVSFTEDAANVLRDAFIKCLAGSPGTPRSTKPTPDDKRVGIYLTANSCLKLLFQCRKLRNAQQIFNSIDAQSPPLSFYPAAQRVTYLYYLGRYHFANSHFYRAQIALQSAYDQCHREALKHRKSILIYLIASNLCLGRFPSSKLLTRPEAEDVARRFLPLCKLIKLGDLGAFRAYLDLDNQSAQWLLSKRILLQLRNRCEILVWRSLIRKTFVYAGYQGEDKKLPYLWLSHVQRAAQYSLARQTRPQTDVSARFSPFGAVQPLNSRADTYVDPDFVDLDAAINETGFDLSSGTYDDSYVNQHPPSPPANEPGPSMFEVESVCMSLIQQGFLRGFVLHGSPRFAIPGAKAKGGPLVMGWPAIWEVVRSREQSEDVPGWVKDVPGGGVKAGLGGSMAGQVVRLSGARAVGVES